MSPLSTTLNPPPLPVESLPPLALPERINRAIDQGVAYLRKHHKGHDQYRNYLGLLGLTLLECGIPAKDPSVQQIAAWLRTREPDLAATYELTLAILFLDRLDDPRDHEIIRTFGQRLVAGQLEGGAWTYSCGINNLRPLPTGLLLCRLRRTSRKSSPGRRRLLGGNPLPVFDPRFTATIPIPNSPSSVSGWPRGMACRRGALCWSPNNISDRRS